MGHPDPRGTSSAGGSQTDVARREGEEVAEDAKMQARATADTARDEAGRVADEAKRHARELTDDARQQLHHQAKQQTDNLGGALEQFGDRLHALAEGRSEDAGPIRDYADRLADQVDDAAGQLRDRGFDGLMDDMQRFARRRPGAFLGGAMAAGFAVSRLARGAKDAEDTDDQPRGSSTGDSGGRPAMSGSPSSMSEPGTSPAPPPPPSPLPDEGQAAGRSPAQRPDPLSPGRARP